MDKKEAIENFASSRPAARAIYGYGSGVFKQAKREGTGKILTDAIFVVDDLRVWHRDNMLLHPSDYSFLGKIHLSQRSIKKIKGLNKINYFSEIRDGEYTFKYGVTEIGDFIESLETWDNLFMAGRFHKPVMEVSSEEKIRESIAYNRKCALIIACLFCDKYTTRKEIFNKLCGLSYVGDARMAIAENPHKVENIVEGSFDIIAKIYPLENDFLIPVCPSGTFLIDYDKLINHFNELPVSLLEYLYKKNTNFDDIEMLRINVFDYFLMKNKQESRVQIIEGIKTNGIVRSVPYALAKVRKRFSKR